MPEVATPATTAPPDDPVRAAVQDREVERKLLAQARAILRRPGIEHEDVVREACRRALANAHKFTPERGSVTVWLGGFVRHVAREEFKKAARSPNTDSGLDRLPARVSDEVGMDDLRSVLHRHLAALPEPLHRAVELRHLEQLDYPAIAATEGTTEATARQRVCRGLALLRTLVTTEASS